MKMEALPVLFKVANPDVCGKGALSYERSGFFGQIWPERTSFGEVVYDGTHYLVIKNSAGTTVYDYAIEFFVTPIITQCQGSSDYCGYVSFSSTMQGSNSYGMINVIQNLPAGTYNIYLYTEYTVSNVGSLPPYLATEGSLSTPAATAVTITSDDIATDNDVLSIEINGVTSNPAPIYECVTEDVNVFFEMDNLSLTLAGQYFVTAKWAEVINCGDFVLLWSDIQINQLHLVYDNGNPTDFLKLQDLRSALDNSPFFNSANAGKRYLIHFTITNGVCPPEEYTRCVVFTDTPNLDLDLTVNLCQGTQPSLPCPGGTSGAYKNLGGLSSSPLLAYSSPTFNFDGSDGVIEYYEATLEVLHSSGATVATVLDNHPLQLSASYFLSAGDVPSQNINAWQIPKNDDIGWSGGNGFIAWASQNGLYYFLLNINAVNGCGSVDDWTLFQVDATNQYKGLPNNNIVIESINSVKISPNPSNGEVSINSEILIEQMLIYDLQGRIIHSEYQEAFNNKTINTTSWIPGMYIYKILQSNNELLTGKIIKK